MSYAVGTTHYNLPQTQGTDKRDWADTNQAFADIDAAIYGAETDSATAVSTANSASSTATSAATDAASAVTTANAASASAASAGELASLARTEAQTAETNASAAVTTANGASANASAAIAAVGDLSDLDTTDKSSAVAAINELVALIGQIGGGGMPVLDYSNPLHSFTAGNLSYTATEEGWIVSTVAMGSAASTFTLTVNNTQIANIQPGEAGFIHAHVKAGDVIVASADRPSLHVFKPYSA